VDDLELSLRVIRAFLPRDASAVYAVARCLSVHVSVTRRYYVERARCIIKPLSPSGSHTTLVFAVPNVVEYSDTDIHFDTMLITEKCVHCVGSIINLPMQRRTKMCCWLSGLRNKN